MNSTVKIATTRLADAGDQWHGPIVEMTTDDHITLVVNLPLQNSEAEADPIDRALNTLAALAPASQEEINRRAGGGQPKASARSAQDREELDDQLNQGLEDSFPASDPVATVVTSTLPKRAQSGD